MLCGCNNAEFVLICPFFLDGEYARAKCTWTQWTANGKYVCILCVCVYTHIDKQHTDRFDSVSTVHNIVNGILLCWNLGNMSSVLKCSSCTWASWSLPASASPLRASVSPPPCSRCVLCRLSDSSDYEHKSSTCQELELPGLCNACLHLEMVWAEDCGKWFAFILMPLPHLFSFNEGSGWWRLPETMEVLEIQAFFVHLYGLV